MATLSLHFKSICFQNYDAYREPIKIRFTGAKEDRNLEPFSVKYVDGFTKGLCCIAIAAIVDHLDARLVVSVRVC